MKFSEILMENIASIILNQLGGNKFKTMTGAKDIYSIDNGLALKFKGCSKTNYLKITLSYKDTYIMEFGKIYGDKYKVFKIIDDVYSEDLQNIFTDITGLYTHL